MKRALWLAIPVLALAGCVSSDHFDAAPVDRNGSFYIDCSPAAISGSYQELCDSVVKTTATNDGVPSQLSQKIIADTLRIKFLLRYSGTNEIKRLRASSTPREDGTYLNCAAIQIEPDEKNGVSFFGENRDLTGYIAALPAECISASAVSVDLVKLWNSVKNSKLDLKNNFSTYINALFGTTPEKFAAAHSGVITAAMFPPANDPRLCLIIPDKEKSLYNRLKSFAGKDVPAEFEVAFDNSKMTYIAHKDDSIIICGSDEIRRAVLKPEKTLAEIPEFFNNPAKSAPPCVELDWAAKGKPFVLYLGGGKGLSSPLKTTEHNIFSRTGYGFYLSSVSSSDWNIDLFRNTMLDFFNFAGLIISFTEPVPEKKDRPGNNAAQQAPADSPECFNRLLKLGEGLKAYAKQNNGQYPAALHTDGFNQLTDLKALSPELFVCPDSGCAAPLPGVQLVNDNTGYVYFGNWAKGSSGKLPLVVDLPDSHNKFFHVLLADGTVQKIGLDMQMSIKRMASALHTVFRYTEEEFHELIRRAEILDKKLDKESE